MIVISHLKSHPIFNGICTETFDKFWDYHLNNSDLMGLVLKFAHDLKKSGADAYSMSAIMNRIRWHYYVDMKKREDEFYINDRYTPMYARVIMLLDEQFAGLFEVRHVTKEWQMLPNRYSLDHLVK